MASMTMALLLALHSSSAFLHSQHVARQCRYSSLSVSRTSLCFDPSNDIRTMADATFVIGRHSALPSVLHQPDAFVSLFGFRPAPEILAAMLRSLSPKTAASSSSLVMVPTVGPTADRPPHRVTLASLPMAISRNNHPLSLHALTEILQKSSSTLADDDRVIHVICCVEDKFPLAPLAGAIARAFPIYTKKTKHQHQPANANSNHDPLYSNPNHSTHSTLSQEVNPDHQLVHVTFVDNQGKIIKSQPDIRAVKAMAEGVRLACRLVDTPPEELTPTAFAQECHSLFEKHHSVTIEEIVGEELREKGYGGIYNVGKAALHPPRLIILTYDPDLPTISTHVPKSPRSIALVGKGITYDTGGLAIKTRSGMCGMKHDMAGAAGLLGGFLAAVQLQTPHKIRLLLCLAENAIGPASFRNDDILTQYSGKTVEINNTDAEGRLLLSDGVAHVTKHYKDVGLVVDMATLTGAQLVSTGKKHAGILANKPELEERAVQAGLTSGDLCFPLLYAPELLKTEFASKVADMKNSVKDRSNAQSSCAGHFIESHLDSTYKGEWLHVDMAGPASRGERGTGYGVGLVLSLLEAPGFSERSL